MAMKVYKFQPPYKSKSKTTFPETQGASGVYIVKEDNKIVYVGSSRTNLYKTMYRHFEAWHHPDQRIITYADKLNRKRYTVRVILCTPARATWLERVLVKKYNPRDNENRFKDYKIQPADIALLDLYANKKIETKVPF